MWIEILTVILGLFILLYWSFKKKYKYWKTKGVYQIEPSFPFGSMAEVFTGKKAMHDIYLAQSRETINLPFYGVYLFARPSLIVRDPDLIKQITIKDFEYFVDRNSQGANQRFYGKTKVDQIWANQLLTVTGEKWKNIRSTFTPIFTGRKMKAMTVFIQESCKNLVRALDKYAEKNEAFEAKDFVGRFAIDAVASCAFGVDSKSLEDENSIFVKYSKNIFSNGTGQMIKYLIPFLVPYGRNIMDFLGISTFKKKETEFFYNIIIETLNQRKQSKVKRNDLIDMMLDAIKGDLKEEEEKEEQFDIDAKLKHSVKKKEFDEVEIVATAMALLIAGYDTTGSSLSWCLYELSKQPEIQEKLRAEIESTCDDIDDGITYEQIQSMTYLDQIFCETLRLHPPIGLMRRSATKTYQIPDTNIIIEKGNEVSINIAAVHMDPKHYETPEIFNPDHFSKEAKAKRHS